jgi:hypothetical protein
MHKLSTASVMLEYSDETLKYLRWNAACELKHHMQPELAELHLQTELIHG